MTYRVDIQILRGLAVLLVVFFHLNIPYFGHGFLGVDAFFVISGFLMALIYQPGSARRFYQRRASRLFPAYFATIIATLIVSAIVILPSEEVHVVEQALFASVFASNVGFWLSNTYFSQIEFAPLLHLWSLGVEFQFYLIVPLLAWLYARSRFLLLILALGSLAACLALVTINPATAFYLMPFRIWQFLAGAAVARYLSQNGAVRFARPGAGALALAVLLLVAMVYPVEGEATGVVIGHPGLAAILVTLATAVMLACGLPRALERSWPGDLLRRCGDWSYSIYLAHFPVIVIALYVPFSGTILTPSGPGQTLALLVMIALASALLYVLFDRRRIQIARFSTAAALVGLTVLVALGSAPVSRMAYSAPELHILGAFSDRSTFRCGLMIRLVNRRAQLCDLTHGLPATAPALLFVGDSHADAIKTSVAKVAQDQGVHLFFAVPNDPLIGSLSSEQLLAAANAAGVDGVIVHYMSGSAEQVLDSGFVDEARQAGLEVEWVLPVPSYGQSIPGLLWQERNTTPVPELEPVNLAAISQLQDRLAAEGIPTVDPRSALCPASCLLMDDQHRPYYFDSNHLTLTGARTLEGILGDGVGWFDLEGGSAASR